MKQSFGLYYLFALAFLFSAALSFCPLVKLPPPDPALQITVFECMRRCKYIIHRPIQKTRCQNCCKTRAWNLQECVGLPPATDKEVSRWEFGKKIRATNEPWTFKLPV